jgi:hypothetical protein
LGESFFSTAFRMLAGLETLVSSTWCSSSFLTSPEDWVVVEFEIGHRLYLTIGRQFVEISSQLQLERHED